MSMSPHKAKLVLRLGARGFALLTMLGALIATHAQAHPSDAEKLEILTARVTAQPADPEAYLKRGAVYSEGGHYDLALADFQKAGELSQPVLVAYDLALLRFRKGEIALARIDLDRFLEHFPKHSAALELRAKVFAGLGETDAAVLAYERLLARQTQPNPGSYLSAVELLVARRDDASLDRALTILDAGIARLGVIPQLQKVAINLEVQRGRNDRALERLESLEPTLGAGPQWKVEKSEFLLRMGRTEDARALLSRASAQLAELRQTPARRELAGRAAGILASIEARNSAPGGGAGTTSQE